MHSLHLLTRRQDVIYLNTTLLLTRSHCFRLHRTARSGEHAQQCWRGHLDVAACDTVNDECSCPNPAGVYHHAVSHTCRPVAAQVAVLRSALTCVCVCVCVCVNVCLRLCLCACVCVCERERERERVRESMSPFWRRFKGMWPCLYLVEVALIGCEAQHRGYVLPNT
jgi:hypothetical protein